MDRSDKRRRGWMWTRASSVLLLIAALAASAEARPKARKPPPTAAAAPAEPSGEPTPEPAASAAEPEPSAEAQPTAAEPAPPPVTNPEPAAKASATQDAEELAALGAELTTLMDDLVQARTRAALLGKTLFKTRIRVEVQNLAEDSASLAKLVLKLDGAPIYRGDGVSLRGDEPHQVFDGYVAPGAHVLSAEVEQNSRADSAYGYALRETYRFQAVREKSNQLTLVLSDDSDVASEFPDEQEGEYDIRTKLRVRTHELSER